MKRFPRLFLSLLLLLALLCPLCGASAEDAAKTVLTICCEPHEVSRLETTIAQFQTTHPDVEVRLTTMPTEDMDELLENGTEGDIFLLASNFTNLKRLAKNGAIAPLASEKLLQNVADMYEPFRTYVTRQGQVYAFPCELLAQTWVVRTDILQQFGSFLGEPPTTMQAYIEQMKQWYDTAISVGSEYSFTNPNEPAALLEDTVTTLVLAYLREFYQTDAAQTVFRNFSTSDFATVLDTLNFLKVADFQQESAWNAAAWGEKSGALYNNFGFTPVLVKLAENEQFMLTPSFDAEGTPDILTYLQFFVIRAGSPQAALANEFMEAFSATLSGRPEAFELYEHTEGLTYTGVSEEALAAYRAMLPSFDLHTGEIISGMFWGEESATDILMAYLMDGTLTQEEALQKLDAMQETWMQAQPIGF